MRNAESGGYEFGVHAFGPSAAEVADGMQEAITVWDQQHRHTTGPNIDVYPAGIPVPGSDTVRLLVFRRHVTVVITWPGAA